VIECQPQTGGAWTKLFDGTSSFLCSSRTNATAGDLLSFQRAIESPQTSLSVALCVDQSPTMEDLKLAAGDLFVRATVGFDKTEHCLPIASTSSTTGAYVADGGSDDARWIIPTVIAAVLAIVLCILVAVWIWKKVRSKNGGGQEALENSVAATNSNQYVGRLSEITPPRESPYGALSTREIGN
jgi:hypothetical protein